MFGKYESLDMECPNCGSIYNVSEICFVCTDLEKIIRDAIKKAETVKKTNKINVKDDLDFAQEKLVAAIIPMVFHNLL
jgi:ATP-dependent protease HslVU (ClpYQ) ATPase subunit